MMLKILKRNYYFVFGKRIQRYVYDALVLLFLCFVTFGVIFKSPSDPIDDIAYLQSTSFRYFLNTTWPNYNANAFIPAEWKAHPLRTDNLDEATLVLSPFRMCLYFPRETKCAFQYGNDPRPKHDDLAKIPRGFITFPPRTMWHQDTFYKG